MANGTAPPTERAQRPGITLRVYTVNPRGTVTADTGTRWMPPGPAPLPTEGDTYYPPCLCMGCRPVVTR